MGTTLITKDFEILKKKRESGQLKIGREKAQFFLNEKVENFKCKFPEAFTIYL